MKMSSFSTNEAVSLEKQLDSSLKPTITPTEQINSAYELPRCIKWIESHNFRKVCLQFPDHLLPDSSQVALRLQKELGQTVYILADTAYGSCCIDYVAAKHVDADAIIHFGDVCLSTSSSDIPFLTIYEKHNLDFEKFTKLYSETFEKEDVLILLDSAYMHFLRDFTENFKVNAIPDDLNVENSTILFITTARRKLLLLNLKYPENRLFYYNNAEGIVNFKEDGRILKRRFFLIEKIKDSNSVGIVVGTLGVKNYIKIIERLKKLLSLHRKKYYIISVGKPTVAKLANFNEIDVYIVVTCVLNEIYDSRDFHKPIVTPYDVEVALNPCSKDLRFSYDYNDFVSRQICDEVDTRVDVSLISGNLRGAFETISASGSSEISLKNDGTVAVNLGYLAGRSWRGLEQNLGATEVKLVEEGRKGIAQKYTEEIAN